MSKHLCLFVAMTILAAGALLIQPGRSAAGELSRNETFEMQFRLNQLKLDAGAPDGIAGSRTRRAIDAATARFGLPNASPDKLLAKLREETDEIEGIARSGGQIDLLVFTDEGTPLILTVMSFGRLHSSGSTKVVRDRDRDGTSIFTNSGGNHLMEEIDVVPLGPGASFGYKVHVPPPPRGERLQIDHVTVRPSLPGEAPGTHTSRYEHIYMKRSSNPRYWWWRFSDDVSKNPEGIWSMALENRSRRLISRSIAAEMPR
ncbi:MAG: peptidoglycan-binding domain-containing protein [Rhizobiaceae bacterium]